MARAEASTDAAFPRATAREILWNSHWVSLRSPVYWRMRFPSSETNLRLEGPKTPVVSTASGSNLNLSLSSRYFSRLDCSCFSAAAPARIAQSIKWVSANVSTQVASQHRLRPPLKGKTVMPSGCRPSILLTPIGSNHDGMFAAARARLTTSFRPRADRLRFGPASSSRVWGRSLIGQAEISGPSHWSDRHSHSMPRQTGAYLNVALGGPDTVSHASDSHGVGAS